MEAGCAQWRRLRRWGDWRAPPGGGGWGGGRSGSGSNACAEDTPLSIDAVLPKEAAAAIANRLYSRMYMDIVCALLAGAGKLAGPMLRTL